MVKLITPKQWLVIQHMEKNGFKWVYGGNCNLKKTYRFQLQQSHLNPEWIDLRVGPDDNSGDWTLQTLMVSGTLGSISKDILKIGWQLWVDSKKNKL